MTLHAAADYGGDFEYPDDLEDLVTTDTLYKLLIAMKGHNHALDKGTPIQRVVFGIEADRPTTTPNEGWVYVATDTHAFWFADGAQWNQVFVLSDETIPVSAGGTGDSTIPIHTVLLGNNANPINHTAVGPDHSLLQGHTNADPTYETHPVVDGMTIDGDLDVTGAIIGGGGLQAAANWEGLTFNGPITGAAEQDVDATVTLPFTLNAAGDVILIFSGGMYTNDGGSGRMTFPQVSLYVDGVLAGAAGADELTGDNNDMQYSMMATAIGLAAGAHTLTPRWVNTGGNANAFPSVFNVALGVVS